MYNFYRVAYNKKEIYTEKITMRNINDGQPAEIYTTKCLSFYLHIITY